MPKRVIPTSEGRLIEIAEGELKASPPAPTTKKAPAKGKAKAKPQAKRKKSKTPQRARRGREKRAYAAGENNATQKKAREIVGYKEWLHERTRQITQFFNLPGGPKRNRFGVPDGMRREKAGPLWDKARAQARIDMDNIKKAGLFDNADAAAEEALEATLTVMRGPMNQQTQLAAARQVLEWTRAKPAAKSDVTVNAAEAWLASLATEDKE